jgi:hypothetical protein
MRLLVLIILKGGVGIILGFYGILQANFLEGKNYYVLLQSNLAS